MRKLNAKQKKIIKEYWENDLLDNTNVEFYNHVDKLLDKLYAINCYENLDSDLHRLINDLNWSDDYKKTIENFS